MAIVKMKRLRLVAMRAEQEELLHLLQRRGCVEICEQPFPEEEGLEQLARPDAGALAQAREARSALDGALAALSRYAPAKSSMLQPRPEISEQVFFDQSAFDSALSSAHSLLDRDREHAALLAAQQKLLSQKQAIAPWLGLDLPLETASTRDVSILFAAVAVSADLNALSGALAQASALTELIPAGRDRELQYFVLFCHKAEEEAAMAVLKEQGYTRANLKGWTGTAAENDRRLDDQLEQTRGQLKQLAEEIASSAPLRPALRQAIDRVDQDIRREEARLLLLDGQSAFYLDGWIPAEEEAQLAKDLDGRACAWETCEPESDDYPQVPVQLKNNWLSRPMSMVTDMYSLPAYGSLDPNPLMAPFFILFYGFMMADMGYGLLMMLVSLFVMKKVKPKGPTVRHMFPLLGLCGVSTFVFGALTGGFFGDFLPQLAQLINPNTTFTALPALFSPLDDALMVLVGSLALGVVQIFTGMALNMYKEIKRGNLADALCNEGAWYLVFLLVGGGIALDKVSLGLIAALVVLVLTQGHGKKGIVGKVMGIFGSLYNNITGYFSDIMSYSRLMALMLAGAVVAQVFNKLGAITGNVVAFVLIAMVGNALNFALNLLGCFVHDMRLQCLEFFGRFYEDGGKPFRPLNINTKNVDIV